MYVALSLFIILLFIEYEIFFLCCSGSPNGALVFVIHSLNIHDAALACQAQDSLYGEENELHHKAGCALLRYRSTLIFYLESFTFNVSVCIRVWTLAFIRVGNDP